MIRQAVSTTGTREPGRSVAQTRWSVGIITNEDLWRTAVCIPVFGEVREDGDTPSEPTAAEQHRPVDLIGCDLADARYSGGLVRVDDRTTQIPYRTSQAIDHRSHIADHRSQIIDHRCYSRVSKEDFSFVGRG